MTTTRPVTRALPRRSRSRRWREAASTAYPLSSTMTSTAAPPEVDEQVPAEALAVAGVQEAVLLPDPEQLHVEQGAERHDDVGPGVAARDGLRVGQEEHVAPDARSTTPRTRLSRCRWQVPPFRPLANPLPLRRGHVGDHARLHAERLRVPEHLAVVDRGARAGQLLRSPEISAALAAHGVPVDGEDLHHVGRAHRFLVDENRAGTAAERESLDSWMAIARVTTTSGWRRPHTSPPLREKDSTTWSKIQPEVGGPLTSGWPEIPERGPVHDGRTNGA
ncbi:hypothetical protein Amir_6810 [Actinosynnema mirum DSM 43827]|uniref:Uncharacterized protein n=1 Tax=Actinosynnema mirum (strain ATCC 29888 / DSM 43827 / JCM 3225 / NBRC 14064 / NCIMB 13271 / NRRL B-12336 / IMRU 3971 / 101) TaxID=446462 RepID=C6WPQ5_ACTMD|nr:hypothetical protein Amir_6810 [Actinosynnema mirum DSM 43827]